MPTLAELRDSLVAGESAARALAKIPACDMKYLVSVKGDDVLIRFGKHNHKQLSHVYKIDRPYFDGLRDALEDHPAFLDVADFIRGETRA